MTENWFFSILTKSWKNIQQVKEHINNVRKNLTKAEKQANPTAAHSFHDFLLTHEGQQLTRAEKFCIAKYKSSLWKDGFEKDKLDETEQAELDNILSRIKFAPKFPKFNPTRFAGFEDQLTTLVALEEVILNASMNENSPGYKYCNDYPVPFEFAKKLHTAIQPIKQMIRVFDSADEPNQVFLIFFSILTQFWRSSISFLDISSLLHMLLSRPAILIVKL